MKFAVGKIFVASIFAFFNSIALAIGIEATDLQYSAEAQIITGSSDFSFLTLNAPEFGIILLFGLGLFGLMLARRRSI